MEVSVIMPVHNAAPFLHRGIQSVLDQPEVVELIAINDASTDHSGEILKLWSEKDDRIIVFHTGGTHPRGPSVARNIGIQKSSADFIAFLDADDYYLPGRFKETKSLFSSAELCSVVIEKVQNISSNGYPESSNYLNPNLVGNYNIMKQLLSFENVFVQLAGVSIKRNFLKKIYFDEKLLFAQDDIFLLDLSRRLTIQVSNSKRKVAHRLLHGNNSIYKHDNRKENYRVLAPKYLYRMDPKLSAIINFLLLKHYLVYSCPIMEKSRFERYLYYGAELCRLSLYRRKKLVSFISQTLQ